MNSNKREINFELKLREIGEEQKEEELFGYAIVWEQRSELLFEDGTLFHEIIKRGAVDEEFLDTQDIVLTVQHKDDRLLARSNKGVGSLRYGIDETGVWFSTTFPNTQLGRDVKEQIQRGDLQGCSFQYSSLDEHVTYKREADGGILREVNKIDFVCDFTIACRPAYQQTFCEKREKIEEILNPKTIINNDYLLQAREIKETANKFNF